MDNLVYGLLLLAAVSHAGWNAIVKSGSSKSGSMILVAFFTSLMGLVFLPFAGALSVEAISWLVLSLLFHFFYKFYLARAYRHGDLAQIYPIMRGAAPLLVLFGGIVILSEYPSSLALVFIVVLVIGVFLAAYRYGSAKKSSQGKALRRAFLAALFIAAYYMADGIGARVSGDAFSYAVWLLSLDGLIFLAFAYFSRGREVFTILRTDWLRGLGGGVLSFTAYGIAIWAMTQIPLVLVASLRETSILFAMLLAWLFIKEPMDKYRIAASLLIVCGIIGLKFI